MNTASLFMARRAIVRARGLGVTVALDPFSLAAATGASYGTPTSAPVVSEGVAWWASPGAAATPDWAGPASSSTPWGVPATPAPAASPAATPAAAPAPAATPSAPAAPAATPTFTPYTSPESLPAGYVQNTVTGAIERLTPVQMQVQAAVNSGQMLIADRALQQSMAIEAQRLARASGIDANCYVMETGGPGGPAWQSLCRFGDSQELISAQAMLRPGGLNAAVIDAARTSPGGYVSASQAQTVLPGPNTAYTYPTAAPMPAAASESGGATVGGSGYGAGGGGARTAAATVPAAAASAASGLVDTIKANPLPWAAGAAAAVWFFGRKKR